MLMRPYRSLSVLMDFNEFLCFFLSPYASLLVLMGPYIS